MKVISLSLVCLIGSASGFTSPLSQRNTLLSSKDHSSFSKAASASLLYSSVNNDNDVETSSNDFMTSAQALSTAATSAVLLFPSIASAAGPDWGLFEGKTGSLLHPVSMFGMVALSISAGLKGFAWRRQRTMGDEISELKKLIPAYEGKTLSEGIASAEAAEESALVSKLKAAMPIQKEIDELVAERKELASQGNRDTHFSQGALLAFIGTTMAIIGPLNTYSRAGKLFPGPHLYAGAGLVICWALAYACVPKMQKGDDTARTIHIGANLGGIGLLAWQVQSGIPILLKVWEKTSWP